MKSYGKVYLLFLFRHKKGRECFFFMAMMLLVEEMAMHSWVIKTNTTEELTMEFGLTFRRYSDTKKVSHSNIRIVMNHFFSIRITANSVR